MTSCLLALVLIQTPDPQAAIQRVRDHYQGLNSFSMVIEHSNSSGLFPGEYGQRLVWAKGGKFELLLSSPPKPGQQKSIAPNYYADGKAVVSIATDGKRTTGGLVPDPNIMPGWEVSGGLILSWLQDTPSGKFIFDPPGDLKTTWSFGAEKSFRGSAAKEIVLTWGGTDHKANLYISPDEKRLLGIVWQRPGQKGWALYKNQQMNPDVPKTLGTPPAVRSSSIQ